MRSCRKSGCRREAVAVCSFNYASRQVWIRPLGTEPDPASYDLCEDHAARFVAPLGWELSDLRGSSEPARTLGL